ncbi:MAG: glycerol-3-phosphate ABC transporter permease [Ilumatobacter coccineus]|uniref:Glycerol-3-phosphate ABC transporter permease n=1 Tax=Ilumatobacter coccineus TaxID=467094 RepID=A0A2G6KGW6_9ACTN|nr:MAG: glycerol-3-phosphate ABC transporter permease [Ilumatobacter coccineus]
MSPTLAVLVFFLYWPALKTITYSTRLARRSAPRTAPRCVSNFTELIGPSRGWLVIVFVVVMVVAIVAGRTLALRSEGWAEVLRPWMSTISVGSGLVALAFLFTEDYRKVYVVTMIISGGIVVLGLIAALGIAFIAYQPVRGASVYRTLLVWPYAISPPIAGLIFFVMFDANTGIIDHLTSGLFGWDLPDYRSSGWLAQVVVILASIWKTLGYNLLFYIAGLQTIPMDQIEAAMIDGAGSWNRFRHIVIPALSPVTFFLVVTNLTYAFFETYGTIDYLTKGGPAGDTSVSMYEIIRVFSTEGDLGRGAAQSMLLFAGVVALTMWQFQTTGKKVHYGS